MCSRMYMLLSSVDGLLYTDGRKKSTQIKSKAGKQLWKRSFLAWLKICVDTT